MGQQISTDMPLCGHHPSQSILDRNTSIIIGFEACEGTPAHFVQAEGHPGVRVFDKPDRTRATVIGEIPSQTCGVVLILDTTGLFWKARQGALEGWVGQKNVKVMPPSTQPHHSSTKCARPSGRLARDIRELCSSSLSDDGMAAATPECAMANPWNFTVLLAGPPATPYDGGVFKLAISVPDDYPMSPPKIKFVTPIFHPNMSEDGDICLDLLAMAWSPAFTFQKTLISICALLAQPDFEEDPYNPDAARLYESEPLSFSEKVREHMFLHCDEPPLPCLTS